MNRSRAHSQQNMRKRASRVARYKSLEASGLSAVKSGDYGTKSRKADPGGRKGLRFSPTNSTCVIVEKSEPSRDSRPNFSSSSESSGKLRDHSPECSEYSVFTGLREIVPKRFLASGTELQSSDEDRNILAMPVEVTRDREDSHLKRLLYGQEAKYEREMEELRGIAHQRAIRNHQRMCFEDKNIKKQTLTIETENEQGGKIRKMIPDGSYIISKENYIISKQDFCRACPTVRRPQDGVQQPSELRASSGGDYGSLVSGSRMGSEEERCMASLPQEIIAERQVRTDILSPGLDVGSASEVVDGKLFNLTTVSLLAAVLALTCVGWYVFFFRTPVSASDAQKVSLLRYLLNHAYDALLQIYD